MHAAITEYSLNKMKNIEKINNLHSFNLFFFFLKYHLLNQNSSCSFENNIICYFLLYC